MVILLSAAVLNSLPFACITAAKLKPFKPHAVFRLRFQSHDDKEMHQDKLRSLTSQPENSHNDIWRLFKEAQQNIMYLNKQRLMAIEELEEMKKEEKSLLDRIEQLELKMQAKTGKDKFLISSELLLRIDAMVLTGMIGTSEACDMRRLVMECKVSVADYFSDILHKRDGELLAEFRHISSKSKVKGLHVVHICTEMAPVASEGSLAAYVTGLSHALQREGNLVEVILPKSSIIDGLYGYNAQQTPLKLGAVTLSLASAFKTLFELRLTVIHISYSYSSLNLDDIQGLREIDTEVFSYFNGQLHGNRIWTGVVRGIGVTFIQPLYYSSFFSREKIHGYSDDFERFTYFSRASLDYLVKSGKQPDVLHIHNWETSLVGPLFWDVFVNQGLGGTRILLTCQGFDSQASFDLCLEQPDKLALCGLDPSSLHRPDRLQDNNKGQLVNILKGGVVYSNKVILVTSTHLEGPLFRSLNHGLEPTLAIHKDKLLIVPSGVDDSMGDPFGNILPNNNPSKWNRMRMDAKKKVSPWDEQRYDLHVSAYLSVANL
ncbi:hypothetical protein RJ640_030644 [Escallonia rubra]|uniref:starch synthase n=1 Tax=Escallonia rubra TaxID=112253 RepID=A0AA88R437_9ASTE|nr:hypothetical protein RJ640_030644 [Escallonia rubra]